MGGTFQDIPGYELLRELGEGGMATVYLAIQHSLDRKVAIKVMRRELRTGSGPMPEFERRFLLEGRTMAKLPHRNIVAVYDIVTREDIAYISMEFLEGGTLSDRMRNGLSLGEAIGIVVQLANGLEFAHRNGVVHRDLKPSNVMFRDAATPVLTDFGIAKQSDVMASRITQTGLVLGTPTYMSPEQASGRETDGRSDQYALGILFYELLTGKPPFVGDTPMAVLMGHALQPPPPLPADLVALQPVFDRMLAKDPKQRFANLQDFVRALRGLVVGNDVLVARLGNVTAASTSERLRALGFSGEVTGGDSDFALDLLRMPRTDPALGARTTGVRPAWRRPRVLVGAGATLAAIVVALTLWLSLRPHTLSDDEQYFVRTLLRQADGFIASGALLAPPGENAFEDVQKVLQKDPGNTRALELVARIAALLREQGERALAAGDLDTAAERGNQALLVDPDDAGVTAFVKRVADDRASRARTQLVGEYLRKAEEAERRRQRTGSGGAHSLLVSALALDPGNATVQARLEAISTAEFTRVRDALARGDNDAAREALEALRAEFGTETAYRDLETRVATARDAAARQQRIDALLASATRALEAGKLVEPPGDNAFEAFGQARELEEGNAAVAAFAKTLVERLVTQAREARDRGDFASSLERAELVMRIDATRRDAVALRDAARDKLGAQRAEIASLLNQARQSIAAGRLLPPARDNARDTLDALLGRDPANAEARALRDALPARVADTLEAALVRQDLDAATTLADAAAKHLPDDARVAALVRDTRARDAARTAETQLREREQRIAAMFAKRPLAAPAAQSAAIGIVALRKDAGPVAARLEQQMADVLAADVRDATSIEAVDAALAIARASSTTLGASAALEAVQVEARTRLAALREQRERELAAQNGELVINALPWGYVDQVLDDARRPVTLPEDRSTPLRLTLPAGSYYVTLRHPGSSKTVSAFARVQPRQRAQASATFAARSADEYVRHAGL